jgi:endonuclease/exonuclease/phosphatase family metal-dependent hydrolase
MRALGAAALLLLSACPSDPVQITLLQANVGNTLLRCQDGYVFKLCEQETEDAVRDGIAALQPDLVALQEILPSCAGIDEQDARFVCHPDHASARPQIERILPDGYSFACDDRNGYECVAAKDAVLGAYEVLPPVEHEEERCDAGFSVGFIAVELAGGGRFTLVNGHPQSGFVGKCRARQLEQVFTAAPERTLLSGDWNLDPFSGTDPSVDVWEEHVGADRRFRYHSGIAERNPPFPTTDNVLFTGVLDHVASDFAAGTCITLGEAADTSRLCPGESCDHRALRCQLSFSP